MRAEVDTSDPVNWDASLNSSLISWWKFLPDEQHGNIFRDLCGRNAGVLTNGPTWSGLSHPGGWGSVGFDGTNDRVVLTTALLVNAPFSIDAWFRTASTNSQSLYGCRNGIFSNGYMFNVDYLSANTLGLAHASGAGIMGTSAVNTGDWFHGCCTNNGTTTTIYVNGVSEASGAQTFTTPDNTPAIGGANAAQNNEAFNGNIAEERFYNRALSASEVAALYQESLAGHPTTLNWQRRMTVFDLGGGGGGVTGSPWWYYQQLLAG